MRRPIPVIPFLVVIILMSCIAEFAFSEEIIFPKIDHYPIAANSDRGKLDSIPNFNPENSAAFQVDLRSYDLSGFDLTGSIDNLLYADFDDKTTWPPSDKMPEDFNRQQIMELGKDPGLGVRNLHSKGITGQNVGIAIIDQRLLVDHIEYKDRLKLYEEINIDSTWSASMHGCAVSSIAVGKTVGVAPGADLYYIAAMTGKLDQNQQWHIDFEDKAKAVRRILEINKQLPFDRKIKVISMSVGWDSTYNGYMEITAAVKEAKAAGMLIVCSSIHEVHGFNFRGLGRFPMSDPNSFNSFEPGGFWASYYYRNPKMTDGNLLVPMDSRTTASPTGNSDNVFYRMSGLSWAIPYIAGCYALAAQVDPKITPEKFWDLAMKTGTTIQLSYNNKALDFGSIINPEVLIEELEKSIIPEVKNDDENPVQFMLNKPQPNPFNPSTTITYQIPEKTDVNLKIFNINGQLVKTLVDNIENEGIHSVVWNGTDNSGRQLGSGIYLYRLKAGDFLKTEKMTFLR